MSKIISNRPPHLYEALKAEGFNLPNECGDVQLTMPVGGVYQLHYVVYLTGDDLAKIGRALARLGMRKDMAKAKTTSQPVNIPKPGGKQGILKKGG